MLLPFASQDQRASVHPSCTFNLFNVCVLVSQFILSHQYVFTPAAKFSQSPCSFLKVGSKTLILKINLAARYTLKVLDIF